MGKSVLIVDDDALVRSYLAMILREEGHVVVEAPNGKEALAKFLNAEFDLVITDLKMPGMSGLELMQECKKSKPEIHWIIITAYGSIGSAVEAIKAGASDYLTKPFKNPEELRHVIRRVLKEAEAERTISLLSEELGKQFPPMEMIFLGEKMTKVYEMVQEVAPTTATVLIGGTSGTGKELIARVVHMMSPRKNRPFVAVHCAALVENLLESELFGHEKGAFTGAFNRRQGRFEIADGGTIFLDEVSEIPPSVQVKLLRVLQERQFERVGGSQTMSVDVRVISATNKDLKAQVSDGNFREDLFYRLNVFPILLPPLVERREAIIPLAEYFAVKYSASLGKKVSGLSSEAKSLLLEYSWPGNIRELQNIIERAVILSKGFVDARHINIERQEDIDSTHDGLLKLTEKETIQRVLAEVAGNRKKAAQILGISLRTLQYRIKEFGIN
ncbi:MAG: two component, sigma-54 specific, transcriptional regulator, Fis family [Deltaproteobacteria bacterium]|nr:two component, sigma-54 specific, transcriptional regulator, Fis family [Deltaproteobacteria bacterium]